MPASDTLKSSRLFGGLGSSHLVKIAALCREESCKEGSTIFREGDEAKDLHILVEGKVALDMKLCPHGDRECILSVVEAVNKGESLGWSAIVEPHKYTLSARCMVDTKLLALNGEKLRQSMAADHDLGYEVMKRLAELISERLTHTRLTLTSERGLALLVKELGEWGA